MSWLQEPTDEAERLLRKALDDATRRTGDEIARRRIWTRISHPPLELPRRSRLFPAALSLIMASAVGGALLVWPTARAPEMPEPTAVVTPVERPPLEVEPAPVLERPARRLVRGPSTIRTGVGERAALMFVGGADADVAPHSLLSVDARHRPELHRGRVSMTVQKQPPGQQFAFSAGPYRITVLGTRFHVRVADGSVGIDVDEGVVEVSRGRRSVRVEAGQSWTSPFRVTALSPAISHPASATTLAAPEPARPAAPVPEAPLVVSAAPAPVAEPRAASAPRPAAASVPGPAERYQQAKTDLAHGKTDRALALLEELAAGQGPAAENAAYELGLVYRDHVRRPRRAVSAWNEYRARFPRGVLRAEADISILETLVSLDDRAAALAEAEAFLRHHPGSERRQEVERLADQLRRSAL